MAIGHVRYSTTGGGSWENAQPVWRDDGRELALAHNGNLTNAVELWGELKERGIDFRGTSDSEIIAALLSSHDGKLIEDAVADVMPRLEGAYSTVVMTKHAIVAFRDPHGVRPLSLGRLGRRFVVASESCAFDIIGAELMREVHPGEMVSLTERGLETRQVVKAERPAHCVFEHIYFSRPDSRLEGKVLQQVRGRMGEILWREAPVEADLVISVPDSGNPAAAGFARASGLPRDDGLIKNRYVARTFIQPGQELRKHGLRLKFNPLPEIVAGQRIVVVDDSIVRGNTTRQIVGMLRDAGASEVHLRISAPPIRHPCHYGVDMSTREEMIAHKRTIEEIADELDADSLAYLSMEGVYEAIGGGARGPLRRLLHRPLPARRPRGRERQIRPRGRRRGPRPRGRACRGVAGVIRRSGRPRLRVAAPTCRRSSTRCTGARGSRWSGSAPTSPTPGAGAGPRRGSRPPSSPADEYEDRAARDAAMAEWIESRGADLVVLAGYMQLLSAAFVARFRDRIVNIHPALLPAFPGLDAIGQALDARGRDDRGDRPLRRRGGRHRAADPPARGAGAGRRRSRAAGGGDPRGRARALPGGDPHDRGGPG